MLIEKMHTKIDHLVIGAKNLRQGIDYVQNSLGVTIPYGGVHVKMGTHNQLMQLGDGVFLEVISINPDIETPTRPRWYGLDDPLIRQQIETRPALLTWVVNTANIKELIQKSNFSLGRAELISRGKLSWYFGLPTDGRLLAGGFLPYAIEWQTDVHPSTNMADLGCSIHSFDIYHPYSSWLRSALESIGALNLVKVHSLLENEAPYLVASINTPSGIKKIYSLTSM